jgi:ribose transport system permease protein
MVLVAGQFDLSIGYLVSMSGILCTNLIIRGFPVALAILVTVVAGVVVGFVNGFLVTKLHINALVATLGTGSVLVGLNYSVSGGAPQDVSTKVPGFLQLAIGDLLGIPRLVYYMVAVAAILWVVLNKTDFGRDIRAVGGNAEAAKLAGVRVARVVSFAFVISAIGAAISGILLAATIGSGQATGGDAYTLSAFAAAFLGSTVMREGQFHIVGTLVGVITVAAGFNGLALIGVPSYAQFLFQGLLLIAAVAFSSIGRRLSRE